jgi:uncharacterized protein
VACRTTRPKRELVRIVRTPAGQIVEDPSGRLAGRGAYVCATGDCRERALGKGALARSLSHSIAPEERSQLLNPAAQRPPQTTIQDEGGARGQE